jgi:hypothetical protein
MRTKRGKNLSAFDKQARVMTRRDLTDQLRCSFEIMQRFTEPSRTRKKIGAISKHDSMSERKCGEKQLCPIERGVSIIKLVKL